MREEQFIRAMQLSEAIERERIKIAYDDGTQAVACYITATVLEDGGLVLYGSFPTTEEAVKWGENLLNATIHPVYVPTFNRG